MLYSELQCSEAIHKAVERMGFAEMTEVQEKTIPVMLAGRDVIAKAPTGTGKTCAFGIPVAEHIDPALKAPQAVILAPTRELAQQIAEELAGLTYFMPEVQVVCVYGGANMEKQAKRLAEGCQIVVATPGRLMDHYKHHSIDLDHVTQVVLDEADEMLNMGFYKDVRHIIGLMKARKSLSMFSATISREVMDIGWMYQKDAEEITVQPKEESQPKITQYMLETSGRNKLSDLAQIIIGEGYKRVMVFCDTKFNTATLANQLARLGFSVDCLHGDLSQKERNQIMQAFRDGKLAILVATDVAARGIDVSDVDAVINYDVPSENEHYTHRIGRTGRAKKEGVSYLFYVPEEKKRVQELLRLTRNTDLCTPVHFDFNHEHIVVEKKQDNADRFQTVQIAFYAAAVVDDHRVAGKRQIARKHHRAVGCGAAGRTGDGVQLCGVGAAALLAVRYFNLPVVHQGHGVLGRGHKAALPLLGGGGRLVQRPDGTAELGVGAVRSGLLGLCLHRAEVLRQHGQGAGDGLAVHRDVYLVPAGGGVIGCRDIGAPALGGAHALHAAKVGLDGRHGVPGHTGDAHAYRAALLHPVGRKLHSGAGLQGEPEGVIVPACGLCGLLQPGISPELAGAAALELGGQHRLRHPPERQLGFVVSVGREEEVLVGGHRAREDHIARAVGDGQRAVAVPLGQGEGRVGVVEDAKLLHREGAGAGEYLVQLTAQQRHLPAPAVGFQLLPGELHRRGRLRPLRGERVAHAHHRRQQHRDAQRHADEP